MLVTRSAPLHQLQTEELTVVVDPSRGCKITSLVDRRENREWLLQEQPGVTRTLSEELSFTENAMCGWDEMLPTIAACTYPLGSLAGTPLADHGEVWSREWSVEEQTPTTIRCSVIGRTVPFHFQREVRIEGPSMTLHYRLSTNAPEGLVALWAPHPQFAIKQGTALSLPVHVVTLDTQTEGPARLTGVMAVTAAGIDGTSVVPEGAGMMLYAPPDVRVSTARLTDPDGTWLEMTWDSDEIPNFAVWMDNGLYAPTPVACPEPMSCVHDNLRRAYEAGLVRTVTTTKPATWSLRVNVGRE